MYLVDIVFLNHKIYENIRKNVWICHLDFKFNFELLHLFFNCQQLATENLFCFSFIQMPGALLNWSLNSIDKNFKFIIKDGVYNA